MDDEGVNGFTLWTMKGLMVLIYGRCVKACFYCLLAEFGFVDSGEIMARQIFHPV